MKKLLVPVDGSAASLNAAKAAVALAKLSAGASIHLVHAHEEPIVYGEIAVYVPREKIDAAQRAHSEAILAEAEAAVRESGVPYTRETLVGPIGLTIAQHAERTGCDAIVMGRHGKTTLGDMLVGSVAMKVLHASRLPVMLVR
ncbi:MAG: universal stress protein [Betaproteobacteria bacterium]|nr:MAG: universal stress protein [Betaproteobacteria bacterium]